MGRKVGWFSTVKRALSHESKEKKDKRKQRSKNRWFGRDSSPEPEPLPAEVVAAPPVAASPAIAEVVRLTEAQNEHNKHVYSVALATAVAAEAAIAQAAAEIVRLNAAARFPDNSKDERAAVKIQSAVRGYLARRALKALRGLVRLKTLVQSKSVKRQAVTTLKCMQTLAHVQSQIQARRIRMTEENLAFQRQLQQKHGKEPNKLKTSVSVDDWNQSVQSKEYIEAKMQSKQEAAMRRERALAYSYSRQQTWRNSSKSGNPPTLMDPKNPHWGWSWLERWMAGRPWEIRTTPDKELDHASVKSSTSHNNINKAHSPSQKLHKPSAPSSRQSPSSTPHSKPPARGRKIVPAASPKGSMGMEDDLRSSLSFHLKTHPRRHSIAGLSVRDDESFASSPAVASYMASTEARRDRSRAPSPSTLGNVTQEKGSVGSAKKRLSFQSPTAGQRHSGPAMVGNSPVKEINVRL